MALQPFWSLVPGFRHVSPGAPAGLFDMLLLVLVALSVPDLRRAFTGPPDVAVRLAGALVALVFLALLVHPSVVGALTVARVCGATCLWMTLRRLTSVEARRWVIGTVVAVAAIETPIALAQIVLRRPFGARVLTGAWWPLNEVGGLAVPRGTFQHQFPLAAFALLATFAGLALAPTLSRGRRVAAALAVTAVPVGITFSRSAVLGLVLATAATLLVVRPLAGTVMLGIAALVLGALVPALLWRAGWQDRMESGAAAIASGNPDLFTSERIHLARGALTVVRAHPLVGIGPGQYTPGSVEATRAAPKFPEEIVHNLPLFVAVEAGLPAGVLMVAILVGAGTVAYRRRGAGFVVFVAVLPFMVLDRLSYDGAYGMAFTAIWLAVVELLAHSPSDSPPDKALEAVADREDPR